MNATVETQTSNKAAVKTLYFNTIKGMVQFFMPSIEGPGIPAQQIAGCISYPEQPSNKLKQAVYNVLTELTKKKLVRRDETTSPSLYTSTLPAKKVRSFRATLVTENKGSTWKANLPINVVEELLGTLYTVPGSTEVKQSVARRILNEVPTLAGVEDRLGIVPLVPTPGAKKGAENLDKAMANLSIITSSDSAGQVHSNNVVKLLNDKGRGGNLPMWTGPLTTEPTDVQLNGDLLLGMLVEGRLSLNQMKTLYLELKEVFE